MMMHTLCNFLHHNAIDKGRGAHITSVNRGTPFAMLSFDHQFFYKRGWNDRSKQTSLIRLPGDQLRLLWSRSTCSYSILRL